MRAGIWMTWAAAVVVGCAGVELGGASNATGASASASSGAGGAGGAPPCQGDADDFVRRDKAGKCYRLAVPGLAWSNAANDCLLWGGHLATVAAIPQHVFVSAMASD